MFTYLDIGLLVAAYLMGSIASAVITCRIMGLPDPRTQGSGNPGATNVLRNGGKKAAAITLLGDVLKGYLPVLAGKLLGLGPEVLALAAVAAFMGHLFPIFFGFKGGKGVATGFGAILGLSALTGATVAATWLSMALLFRYSSLAALTAALTAPVYAWLITGSQPFTIAVTLIGVLLVVRHHSNIRKLLSGKEDKIGQKKTRSLSDLTDRREGQPD